MPALTAQIALSMGDTLDIDTNTPGGYTLAGHSTNTTSLEKIQQGDWDFVTLQEQSQIPAFPIEQVETDVFPFAAELCDIIRENNLCAIPLFFMTWGRENGDADNCDFWPPVCDYEGQDSLLHERYMMMTEMNDAEVSPVGAVWHYLRENNPNIDMYASDGSHPSQAGSYAAAVCFYSCIFRRDPTLIPFNYDIDDAEEFLIKSAVKTIVFDHLEDWFIGTHDPIAVFAANNVGPTYYDYEFTNLSENANTFVWNFGDETTSEEFEPIHTFGENGYYTVVLSAANCGMSSMSSMVILASNDIEEGSIEGVNFVQVDNVLNITASKGSELSEMTLFDSAGNIVKYIPCKGTSFVLDAFGLSPGMYILNIKMSDGRLFSRKLLFSL